MAARMETTRYPGIYRRGSTYVVVWRHRGRQHESAHRTLAEAREAQGQRRSLDSRQPATRERFEDYAASWLGVLNPAADRAGVPWATFHTFRHTCASMLFEEGRNLAQVAGWLGHADPAFTLRTYVHLMDGGLGDADFLDGITSPPLRRVA